ncbi:hypothetical protein Patl1_31965 [Pistacia atlantica]|uniref:Uncharacterized protein n=1 Tax=Pistacia atlantica TaxID=434234 RepID=A0ACC1APL7_9ROSI|nr:hypothetical protein Patl1_31965 [Pistacia atlantica]
MTSVCISNCVNDARDPRVPVRATYVNLYKWPESDAEFVRSVTSRSNVRRGVHVHGHPRVVDSISCRQMYLRSYKFSRDDDKEAENEKTAMCFGRVKEKDKEKKEKVGDNNNNNNYNKNGRMRKRKDKERRRKRIKCLRKFSCNALFRLFHRLLSCGASIDVADR